jgi:hypothetical protein
MESLMEKTGVSLGTAQAEVTTLGERPATKIYTFEGLGRYKN